ncbi:dihydrofolate reductase family protein [Bacteroides fragilis]|nr:dihydrofolate reductase family protein [Bacteroides fragilis]
MAKVQMLALQSIDGYMIDNRPELSAILSDEIAMLRTAATHLLNKDISLTMLSDWAENEAENIIYLIEADSQTVAIIDGMFRMGLIDEIILYTIPAILGGGKRLYQTPLPEISWRCTATHICTDGTVQAVFRRSN